MPRRVDSSLPLNPGLLRDLVHIQRPIKTQDAMGGDIVTGYTLIVACWCHVRAMTGRELEAVQQVWASARFKIRTWLPPVEVRREDVCFWKDRQLDILDAEDPDGRGRELVIYAKELVA